MSAELLLREFERVSGTPDAIGHLRRFVLDLAVRGRIVRQELADESAVDLLKQIAAEKSDAHDRRQSGRNARPIGVTRVPFPLPESWVWVRLGDVLTKLTDGTHHSPPNLADGPYRYITAKNIKTHGVSLSTITYVSAAVHEEIYARCNPESGDVLYVKDGATTGVVAINDLVEPFSMLSSVALLKLPGGLFNRLLVAFLRSPFFYDQMRERMKGSALPRVTLTRMAPALLPLPPLAEQHRIVAKIDELMTLCDQLEAAQDEREAWRDSLRAASLQRLMAAGGGGAGGSTDVRFFLKQSTRLVTKAEHVAAMRRKILDLAVRGRLVPQISDDEPPSALFGPSPVPERSDSRDLPRGWARAALREIAPLVTSGSRGWAKFYSATGANFVRSQNVKYGHLLLSDLAHVSPPPGAEGTRSGLAVGDLLVVITGDVGNVGLWSRDLGKAYISQHVALVRPLTAVVSPWLLLWLMAPSAGRRELLSSIYGGKPGLDLRTVRSLTIALPPLAEQQRIVAKVDELMAVCDELERVLTTAQSGRARLLEALLYGALDGSGAAVPAPL